MDLEALAVGISQACAATSIGTEPTTLRQLPDDLRRESVLIKTDNLKTLQQ
jgi:hypothetical protein